MKNMRNITIWVLIFVLLFSVLPIPVEAYTEEGYDTYGDFKYWYSNIWKNAKIYGYTGTGGTVIIPKKINGYTVEAVYGDGFRNNTNITSVIFPSSILTIDSYAFLNCTNLSNISFLPPDNGRLEIKSLAFQGCTSLKTVSIPNAGFYITLYSSAFYGCSNLRSISLGNSVKLDNVSISCEALESIEVDSENEDYSSYDGVLYNKSGTILLFCPEGMNGNYTIIEGTKKIQKSSFAFCSLNSVHIPTSVNEIEAYSFSNCKNLSDVYYAGTKEEWKNITIGENNYALENANIHFSDEDDNVIISSFELDSTVTVAVGNTIPILGKLTLDETAEISFDILSKEVSSIKWTSSDQSIVSDSEISCTGVNSYDNRSAELMISFTPHKEGKVTITGTTSNGLIASCEVTVSDNNKCGDHLTWTLNDEGILTISGTGDMWNFDEDKNFAPWSDNKSKIEEIVIENGVISIGDYAFASCNNVFWVDLANTVKTVGSYAFKHCTGLTTFKEENWFPLGNALLEEGAFYGCTSLMDLCIPDNVISIGGVCFYGCAKLNYITLPQNLETIGYRAFYNCFQDGDNITKISLTIPPNVKSIGREAFYNTVRLYNIWFDGNAPVFNSEAFSGASMGAHYYIDDATWAESVKEDYGGEISWLPRYGWTNNGYFILKEDTNSWGHSKSSFFNGDEKKFYSTSSEYKKKLTWYEVTDISLVNALSYVVNANKDPWEGSCFGLAVSEIAKHLNYYDDRQWGEVAENFFKLNLPKNNIALRDMIQYFHLLQNLSIGQYSEKITAKSKDKDCKVFWDNLMKETKKCSDFGIPILLGFNEKGGGGHTVIICGYDDASLENMFLFKIYDPNSTSSQFETLFLNTSDYSFSFQDSNARNSSRGYDIGKAWEQVVYHSSDKVVKILATIDTKQNTGRENEALFTYASSKEVVCTKMLAEYGKSFTLTNSKGENLVYSGKSLDYNGSMGVHDIAIQGEGNGKKLIFEIDYDSEFELTDFSDGFFGIQLGDTLYSLDCANVSLVSFDNVNGVRIQGDNSSYTAYVINENDVLDEQRVTHFAKAESSGNVAIIYTKDGLMLKSEDEIGNISGGIYYGGEETKSAVKTDDKGNYLISASKNEDASQISYTISYTLNGGSVSGNPTNYKPDDLPITLKNPTRNGYAFIGWTGSNGNTPQKTVTIAKGSTGNKSYTANWSKNQSAKTSIKSAKISLKKTSYVYDGKKKQPSVTVKAGSKTLKKGTDYKVTYRNNQKVGTASVIISGTGEYTGKVTKKFKIVPKGTSVSKVTSKSKGFTVRWRKQAKSTDGYQIQYSTNKRFTKKTTVTKTVKKTSKTKLDVKKCKVKKKYYIHISTYKTVKGKKYYSGWSKIKVITTKK